MRINMRLISERDTVAHLKMTKLSKNKIFFQMNSIDHPDYPERPNIVRMYQNVNGYQRPNQTIPNCLDYTEIDQFDMNGNFPSRLFNMFLASSTKAEVEKMYKYIKDKK